MSNLKTHLPAKSRLKLLGAAILQIGLGAAAWIWIAQDRLDRHNAGIQDDSGEGLSALDSRKQVRELEIQYGQTGLVFEEGLEWVESLAHGKRLAVTVAVASSVFGIGCFLLSARRKRAT